MLSHANEIVYKFIKCQRAVLLDDGRNCLIRAKESAQECTRSTRNVRTLRRNWSAENLLISNRHAITKAVSNCFTLETSPSQVDYSESACAKFVREGRFGTPGTSESAQEAKKIDKILGSTDGNTRPPAVSKRLSSGGAGCGNVLVEPRGVFPIWKVLRVFQLGNGRCASFRLSDAGPKIALQRGSFRFADIEELSCKLRRTE